MNRELKVYKIIGMLSYFDSRANKNIELRVVTNKTIADIKKEAFGILYNYLDIDSYNLNGMIMIDVEASLDKTITFNPYRIYNGEYKAKLLNSKDCILQLSNADAEIVDISKYNADTKHILDKFQHSKFEGKLTNSTVTLTRVLT